MKWIDVETQYKALFDRSHDAIFLLDLSGHHIVSNQKAAEIFGYSTEELVGLSYRDLSAEIDESQAMLKRLINGENIGIYRRRFRHKDGHIIPVEIDIELVKSSKGVPIYFQSIIRDVSDRVENEEKIAAYTGLQLSLLEMTIELMGNPIEQSGNSINQLLERIGEFYEIDRVYYFKYDVQNQVMNNAFEWCGAGILPQIDVLKNIPFSEFPEWVEVHMNGGCIRYDDVSAMPDGAEKESLIFQGIKNIITIPVMFKETCLGFVGFDSVRKLKVWRTDEVDLLKLLATILANYEVRISHEAKLFESIKKEEAANASKSQFLANMSHELRTPLNGIIGSISLLKQFISDEKPKVFLETVEFQSNLLMDKLNDLLDYARIEKDEVEIDDIVDQPRTAFSKLFNKFELEAADKELGFEVAFSENVPTLLVLDFKRVEKVLSHLLSNAVKFTEMGQIGVSFDYMSTEHLLLMTVKDTGEGMSEALVNKVFSPFVQGEASASRRFEGMGLGLSLSKSFVQQLGGEIQIMANAPKGTVVSVKIPAGYKPSEVPAEASYKSMNPIQSRTNNLDHSFMKSLETLKEALELHRPINSRQIILELEAENLVPDQKVVIDAITKHIKRFEFAKALEALSMYEEGVYESPK